MNKIQKDVSAPAMVAAIEANEWAFFLLSGFVPPSAIHDDPDMIWSVTDIPFPLFNVVLRSNMTPDMVDTGIKKAVARCRSRSVPMLWFAGPAAKPADLNTYLERYGFVYSGYATGMAIDLMTLKEAPPTPAGMIIERVGDQETLRQWIEVTSVGFGIPDAISQALIGLLSNADLSPESSIRYYICRLNGEPVAASSLFLGAGVAGIYNVATVPEARRKGIGAAMTHFPLIEARTLGYRVGILQASDMGANVYHQLGFQEYCKIGHYVWSPEATPA